MPLQDRVAIVTGASTGLGQAIAEQLAAHGARVVLSGRDESRLKAVAAGIRAKGDGAEIHAADVTKKEDIDGLMDAAMASYKRIDILVNNAGWSAKKMPFEETSMEEYERSMRTNVDSVFYASKKIIPIMKKQGTGVIVNIASMAAKRAHGQLAAYSASKFAVLGFTQAAARNFENTGPTCIAICPGGINTDMRRELFGAEDAARQQSPEQVASIIMDVLEGKTVVPNGGDIEIVGGKIIKITDPFAS